MIEQASSRFSIDSTDLVVDGSFAESRFRVDIDPASPDSLFSVETLASGIFGLGPQTTPQEAWMELLHKTTLHGEGDFAEGLEIALAREGPSGTLNTEAFSGDEIGGNEVIGWSGYEVDRGAAPPGADLISIQMRVGLDPDDPDDIQIYPLITEGRVWQSERDLIGHDPMRLTIGGYLSRFEGIRVFFVKEAGVGLFHGQIIIALLELAGIPPDRIAIDPNLGEELFSQLQISCSEGVSEARRIADTARHFIVENAEGIIVARPIAPISLAPVAEIELRFVESSEILATISANTRDVPKRWRVEGARPELPELADGFVSVRTMESETIEPFTVPDSFVQGVAGALALARSGTTNDRITSQIWITNTFFQGCLIESVTETWGQFNPEAHRYVTATPGTADGEPRTYSSGSGAGFVFGDGAVIDDTNPMRRWYNFMLAPITVERTRFIYDSDDTFSGIKISVITSRSEWKNLENAQKAKTAPGNTWDEEVVRPAIRFFGGGRFVTGLGSVSEPGGIAEEIWFEGPNAPDFALGQTAGMGATFFSGNSSLPGEPTDMVKVAKYAQQTIETITILPIANERGLPAAHETARKQVDTGYRFGTKGDQFLPQGSSAKETATEEGNKLLTLTRNFIAGDSASHKEISLELDGDGAFVKSETKSGQPGWLPDAEVCTPELLSQESIPVHGLCIINSPDYTDRVEIEAIDFGIESEGAAALLACDRLRERSAHTVALSLPLSPLFYPGAPVILRALHKGIDPDSFTNGTTVLSNAWVESVGRLGTIRPDAGQLRRLVAMTLRLPIF